MNFYSVVIPVYNRPEEVDELLNSLSKQTYKNFEVLIIEDGSSETCEATLASYEDSLDLHYYFKENSGQGFTRNFGFERAKGDYFVVFDSDCLIPPTYFETVDKYLSRHKVDAFGGPDAAHPSFTVLQKAISYSMTSPFTTGGIRGNKKHVGVFHPRSFNMGISREVYESTKGYNLTRMGEDIEFSIRIINQGFTTVLIQDAFVYHKRRTSLKQFYKQLHFFGRARINVNRYFPGELKLIHLLPAVFTVGFITWLSTLLWSWPLFQLGSTVLSLFFLLVMIHAFIKTRNVSVSLLSLLTSFTQLFAYGVGMISEKLTPRGNQPFAQK